MILFLYGEDGFRSREKLRELCRAYADKNPSSDWLDIDAQEYALDTIPAIKRSWGESGLFTVKKLIVVRRLLVASESVLDQALAFFEADMERLEADRERVLILWEEHMPKKNRKLFKFLDKHVVRKQYFEPLKGVRLEQWIVHRIHLIDARTTIERGALVRLASETGGDLFALEQRVRQLVDVCENGRIDEASVASVLIRSVKEKVFEALEALASGHRDRAMLLFEGQLEKGENALYLLSMCAWQWRGLYRAADAYADGFRTSSQLARELHIAPFAAQKFLRRLPDFSAERLRRGFALLSDFERQSKSGRIDPELALSMAVMKL
jgi:DNA polymerase III delta subunit